jgi:hypothetical protein
MLRSVQTLSQRAKLRGQPQAPAEQTTPGMQLVPQLPQLRRSLIASIQTPPHTISFSAHVHTPATHVEPPTQAVPQVPQWAELVWVSTHAPPQLVAGGVQDAVQVPPAQTMPAPQGIRQPPQ